MHEHLLEFAGVREQMAATAGLGSNGHSIMARLKESHDKGGTILAFGTDSAGAVLSSHFQEECCARYTAGGKKVPAREDREAVRANDISRIRHFSIAELVPRLESFFRRPDDTLVVFCVEPLVPQFRIPLIQALENAGRKSITVCVAAPSSETDLLHAADISFAVPSTRPPVITGAEETIVHAMCEGLEIEWNTLPENSTEEEFLISRTSLFPDMLRNTGAVERALAENTAMIECIRKAGEAIYRRLSEGGCLFVAGNGGSACDALQIAMLIESLPLPDGKFPCVDTGFLSPGYLTCCWNDGFDPFPRGIESVRSSGDILIGFSTSGNSENVRRAVEAAGKKGILTIVFTGGDGGKIAGLADHEILVPAHDTGIIQEAHWSTGSGMILSCTA